MCVHHMNSHYRIVNGLSVENIFYLAFHFVEIVFSNVNFLYLKPESFGNQSFQVRYHLIAPLSGAKVEAADAAVTAAGGANP